LKYVKSNTHPDWVRRFRQADAEEYKIVGDSETHPKTGEITMGEVIALLSEKTKGEAVVVADVGQHQMMAARYYKFQLADSFITSGGLGTMGFGVPAAMGAKVASPDRQVVAVVGDGSFQMTLQELITIHQDNIPVKIIILNNNFLGMVRQWQEMFFEKRYSFVDLHNPDFITISRGCGIDAEKVNKRENLSQALDKLLESKSARLLEIVVKKEGNVFPMVPSGASVDEIRLK
jgi:acetolactate synthase-1/2/3 large subunit